MSTFNTFEDRMFFRLDRELTPEERDDIRAFWDDVRAFWNHSTQRVLEKIMDDQSETLNPRGGLPRKRLKFVYLDPAGVLTGVVWEASGEVRTIAPGDYQQLEPGVPEEAAVAV